MKNLFTLFLLFGIFSALYSQTIVGTDPENRNAVLEEFTGIHCGYCPDGHRIAHDLMELYPEDFFLIAIHVGGYASPGAGEPDFRTEFGSAIMNQADLQGYPAGTINRHLFPGWSQQGGSGSAMSRDKWDNAAEIVIDELSYVNIEAEAEIDVTTNELTVHVEVYYTGNSPESTNKLNVALLQSNIEGPQSGSSANPDFVLPNGNYSHQHMLRYLVTGQWGDEISTTTAGSFIDRNYTYSIPSDYLGVGVDLSNLSIVAFISETTQEIESGTSTFPLITGLENVNDAMVTGVSSPSEVCGEEVIPTVTIRNNGSETLTSVIVEYSVNNGDLNLYTWSGELLSLQSDVVELPASIFTPQELNTITVYIHSPNGATDEDNSNNSGETTFNLPMVSTLTVYLEFKTDQYGGETSWELIDGEDNVMESGSGYGNNTVYNEEFILEYEDCYSFIIYDQYGDGICCDYGNGYYTLTDSDGIELKNGGEFGSSETTLFNVDLQYVSIESNSDADYINIYPNPTTGILNIQTDDNAYVFIYATDGNLVGNYKLLSHKQIDLSHLSNGIYFVKINTDNKVITKKISLNR